MIAIEWLAEPLSGIYLDRAHEFFPSVQILFVYPEAEELAGFLLAVFVPLALAAGVLALGSRREDDQRLDWIVVVLQIAVVGFVAWVIWKQRQVARIAFLGAFDRGLLPEANLIAGPVIGAALTALALRWRSDRLAGLRGLLARGRAWPPWAAAGLAVAATALWLLPGVITDQGVTAAGLIPFAHTPIEFDEFVAVSNGRTPLVDYVPWYGSLLPISLGWLWPIFDHSITSFTVTMVLLSAATLLAVYAAFRQLTENSWSALILYLPFLAMALQPWDTEGVIREFNGSYYAIMPSRYLGPFVLVWLCARHLRRGSPPLWALFGIAGLVAFNNPEFGVPALLAALAAVALGADRDGPGDREPLRVLAEAGAGIAGAVILACAVILVRSGELPDPELLGYVARVTSRGYGLVAIPEWGLHWALYVTQGAAVLLAAVRFVNRSPHRVLTGLLAFAGVFGLLTGGYFAGRSLPWQLWGLFPAWGLTLALLGLAGWRALRAAEGVSLRRIVVPAFAALTGFGLMVANIDRFPPPWEQIDRIEASGFARFEGTEQQRFVEARTEPGERVLILGASIDHRVAERAGVENVSPWLSVISIFGPAELERALDQVEDRGGEAVFVQAPDESGAFGSGDLRRELGTVLRERGYVVVADEPTSQTVEWRRVG